MQCTALYCSLLTASKISISMKKKEEERNKTKQNKTKSHLFSAGLESRGKCNTFIHYKRMHRMNKFDSFQMQTHVMCDSSLKLSCFLFFFFGFSFSFSFYVNANGEWVRVYHNFFLLGLPFSLYIMCVVCNVWATLFKRDCHISSIR